MIKIADQTCCLTQYTETLPACESTKPVASIVWQGSPTVEIDVIPLDYRGCDGARVGFAEFSNDVTKESNNCQEPKSVEGSDRYEPFQSERTDGYNASVTDTHSVPGHRLINNKVMILITCSVIIQTLKTILDRRVRWMVGWQLNVPTTHIFCLKVGDA